MLEFDLRDAQERSEDYRHELTLTPDMGETWGAPNRFLFVANDTSEESALLAMLRLAHKAQHSEDDETHSGECYFDLVGRPLFDVRLVARNPFTLVVIDDYYANNPRFYGSSEIRN